MVAFNIGEFGERFTIETSGQPRDDDLRVVALADGRFLVYWTATEGDGSGSAILGQFLDTDGNLVGSSFVLNSQTVGTQNEPIVAALPDGGFAVAYQSFATGSSRVLVTAYEADGSLSYFHTVASDLFVNNTIESFSGIDLAVRDDGTLFVSFVRSVDLSLSPDIYIIEGRFISPSGELGNRTEFAQLDTAPNAGRGGGTSATAVGENFAIAYQDRGADEVVLAIFNQNGGLVAPETRVFSERLDFVEVITLSDGSLLVGWVTDRGFATAIGDDTLYQKFTADGTPIGEPRSVDDTIAGREDYPSFVPLEDGGFLALWSGSGSESLTGVLEIRAFDASGDPTALPTELDTQVSWADLAVNADGTIVAVYVDADPVTFRPIISAKVGILGKADPDSVGFERFIDDYLTIEQRDLSVTQLEDGRILAVWYSSFRFTNRDGGDVIARYFNPDGTPEGNAFVLEAAGTREFDPDVVALPGGGFAVAFMQDETDGTGDRIVLATYDSNAQLLSTSSIPIENGTNQPDISVEVNDLGELVVVFEERVLIDDSSRTQVTAVAFNADGTPKMDGSSPIAAAIFAPSGNFPATQVLPVGENFLFIWTENSREYDARLFDSNLAPLAESFTVISANIRGVISAEVLSDGNIAIAWTQLASSFPDGNDAYYQLWTTDGFAITEPRLVRADVIGDQMDPKIAALDQGGFVITIAEADSRNVAELNIVARQYDGAGNLVGGPKQANELEAREQANAEVIEIANGNVMAFFATDTSYFPSDQFKYNIISTIELNGDPTVAGPLEETLSEDDALFLLSLLQGASDPNGDMLSIEGFTLVSGDNSGFSLNGTSLEIDPGAYNALREGSFETVIYSYQVSDGNGGSTPQTATVTIEGANDQPDAVEDEVEFNEEPTAALVISFADLLANDSDPDNDELTIVSLDSSGGTHDALIDQATQQILLTKNTSASTQSSFTYTISDGNGGFDTATVNFSFLSDNSAPVAVNTFDTAVEDSPVVSGQLSASDDDGDVLTFSLTAPLDGLVLQGNGSWDFDPSHPSYQYLGTGESTTVVANFSVSDGKGGEDNGQLSIQVAGTNDNPDVFVGEGQSDTLTIFDTSELSPAWVSTILYFNYSDPDINDVHAGSGRFFSSDYFMSLGIFGGATDTQLNGNEVARAILVYQLPGINLDRIPEGVVVTEVGGLVVLDDSTGSFSPLTSDLQTVTVTLVGANDKPVVSQALQDQSIEEDTSFEFDVPVGSFSDIDDGTVLSYSAMLENGDPLPGWLSFDPSTQKFSGKPPIDWSGTLSIVVTASDGSLTASDIFQFNVEAVNDAPVANDDYVAVDEDATLVGSVLNNDSDVDSPALSVFEIAGELPGTTLSGNYGTLTLLTDGTYSYVADADVVDAWTPGTSAIDSFEYRITDGELEATASLNITVTAIDDQILVQPIDGTRGPSNVIGTDADELIVTGRGNDTINGGGGADTIDGGRGTDIIFGGPGFDTLSGGNGSDLIFGEEGNDVIDGGKGNDIMSGGPGADTFIVSGPDRDRSVDTITDFKVGEDRLSIDDALTIVSIEQTGGDTIIEFSNGSTLILEGVDEELTEADLGGSSSSFAEAERAPSFPETVPLVDDLTMVEASAPAIA